MFGNDKNASSHYLLCCDSHICSTVDLCRLLKSIYYQKSLTGFPWHGNTIIFNHSQLHFDIVSLHRKSNKRDRNWFIFLQNDVLTWSVSVIKQLKFFEIALAFYLGFSRKRFKRRFLFFQCFRHCGAESKLPASYGLARSCPTLIVCRSPVRISAWTLCIYTDITSGCPKTLQSNARMTPQLGPNHFQIFSNWSLTNHLQFDIRVQL